MNRLEQMDIAVTTIMKLLKNIDQVEKAEPLSEE